MTDTLRLRSDHKFVVTDGDTGHQTVLSELTESMPTTGAAEIVITEDASGAAGTYTGSVTVPGGATITGMFIDDVAIFGGDTGIVRLDLGDGEDPNGFVNQLDDLGQAPGSSVYEVLTLSFINNWGGTYLSTYKTVGHALALYSPTDHVITAIATTSGATTGTFLGEVRILVTWAKATPVAATFEAAP